MSSTIRRYAAISRASCTGLPIWKLTRSSDAVADDDVASLISETRATLSGFNWNIVRASKCCVCKVGTRGLNYNRIHSCVRDYFTCFFSLMLRFKSSAFVKYFGTCQTAQSHAPCLAVKVKQQFVHFSIPGSLLPGVPPAA